MKAGRGGTFNRPRDWQAFERLTRDLFSRLLGDVGADLNGRSGQKQAGIDVVGVDWRTGQRVGIQCKGRSDPDFAQQAALSEPELLTEVAKARTFVPPLDRFILLTTGPNDAHLKRVARVLSDAHRADGLFSIDVLAWDWVETYLDQHIDLAVGYNLTAVIAASSPVKSPIAVAIGERLLEALRLMNVGREDEDRFTLQELAQNAGHASWQRLEQIADGSAPIDLAELRTLAEDVGICFDWLFQGKSTPFAPDQDGYSLDVEEIHATILSLRPERILFVRQREGGHGHHDALIAIKKDPIRWRILPATLAACDQVGSGGARQLFDLCRLIRRLESAFGEEPHILTIGMHLDSPAFDQLLDGSVYPGTILRYARNDHWSQDFAALQSFRIEGDAPHLQALRNAVEIVQHQLAHARRTARASPGWADVLTFGRFRLEPPKDGGFEADD
ncbi:hypothetical protein HL653_05905 [Sphingomonas sp. AP4-R1]|uniref:hypothetical protein n=1 Tax=Sphingomonas sp. AP4-R1 TaxID=2735134 RepID=UPI001493D77A|nr:hypothetical protein [Sphingomonas sp. AP4-R1]QJU57386.1 hypothetical protein HL653_05905 [Sphingomonas sp. AP4-R1]